MARMPLKPRLVLLAAPAALLIAACGSSSKSTAHLPTQPTPTAPAATGLVTFNHTGFSIGLLPGKHHRAALSLQVPGATLKLVLYLVQQGDLATAIGSFTQPFDQKQMTGAIAGGARAVSGSVHDEVATTYQGHPARDARINSDAKDGTVFVRTVSTATRTYLLEYIVKGPDHTTAPAGLATFLSSLKLA